MYTCIKLNLYCEGWCPVAQEVKSTIIKTGLPFRELHNTTLLFSSLKNPDNIVVAIISSRQLLLQIEEFVKTCHNYQNRIFIVYKNISLHDNFFIHTCAYPNLNNLSQYLTQGNIINLNPPTQPSTLLTKLVKYELQKLQIPTKYVGFNYLTQLAVNYLCNNYPPNTYIELFEYVASINLASIDTIERDVRHMILTTWKNNTQFRNILERSEHIEKPNSKNILNHILAYLKQTI